MINRNGSFIVGYMAGRNDRVYSVEFNNWGTENLAPEYREGYKAGYEGKGKIVIEMPDEIESYAPLCVGNRVKHKGSLNVFGTINQIGTEHGPDYVSVKWDGSLRPGFDAAIHKGSLIKVD